MSMRSRWHLSTTLELESRVTVLKERLVRKALCAGRRVGCGTEGLISHLLLKWSLFGSSSLTAVGRGGGPMEELLSLSLEMSNNSSVQSEVGGNVSGAGGC